MMSIAPRKKFSQNFLTDPRTARRIVELLDPSSGDAVIEIGPGTGALTTHLVDSPVQFIAAYDVDARVEAVLSPLIQRSASRLELRIADVLSVEPAKVLPFVNRDQRKVVGNIPYAITSAILFWLFDARFDIERAVIMMQKEVARRCIARPGSKEYGILSVASWYASTPTLAMTLPPGAFFPRPSVTSAVISFSMRRTPPTTAPFAPFMTFVRAAFGQRRKVMSNGLAQWAAQQRIEVKDRVVAGVELSRARAEELDPEELASVFLELKGAEPC
jgi:16S rRNA (adenine1518-N6/adenine1519-N6)-dimethyltransferase